MRTEDIYKKNREMPTIEQMTNIILWMVLLLVMILTIGCGKKTEHTYIETSAKCTLHQDILTCSDGTEIELPGAGEDEPIDVDVDEVPEILEPEEDVYCERFNNAIHKRICVWIKRRHRRNK
jgi:hypothetical protein